MTKPFFFFLIWLHWVLVETCQIFSCSMQTLSCVTWDLVPWPGLKPRPPALGARSLSPWTTREVLTESWRVEQSNGRENDWRWGWAALARVISVELALELRLNDMKEVAMERWLGQRVCKCKGPGAEWEGQARACELSGGRRWGCRGMQGPDQRMPWRPW